ncbi:hypothetical protein ABLE94_01290 [Gordonia sp. VNK1]|uniref:hypothetical protein n=1 Tax=Gordonia oleivorans TaxID=3156618 RepID=UPI0032B5CF99
MTPTTHPRRMRRAATAAVLVALAAIPTACAATENTVEDATSYSTSVSNAPAPGTLDTLADDVAAAGLPVTGRHTGSAQDCSDAGCGGILITEQFTLMQFESTGRAELYAGEHTDAFQLLNVVVTFPASVSDEQQTRYEDAIEHALN